MVPGINFTEILVIGVVALIVIGPRELPKLARMVAGYIRQARGLARDFQKSFDEMGRQLELDDLKKEVEALRRGEPFKDVTDELKGLERDLKSSPSAVRALPTSRQAALTQAAGAPSTAVAPAAAPAASVSEPAPPHAQGSVSEPAPPAQVAPLTDHGVADAAPVEERKVGGL